MARVSTAVPGRGYSSWSRTICPSVFFTGTTLLASHPCWSAAATLAWLAGQTTRVQLGSLRSQGIGLATYLRRPASDAAREARRARIRAESAAVARYIAENPEAQAFMEDWGGGP